MNDVVASLQRNQAVLDFLLTRRSRPPRFLTTPAPPREDLRVMLTAAARVPDHGKLEPWRFIVLERDACARLADLTHRRGAELGLDADKLTKDADSFLQAPVVVAVIASPKASEKIPRDEQLASAAAVCLGLVNAALACGWGASWLTGWRATDREYLSQGLDLAPSELVAGYIHIGAEAQAPQDRPRPDIDTVTTWIAS